MPFFGPRDAQYDPDGIPLPPNFEDASGEGCPLKHRLLVENYRRNGHSGLPLRTEDDWRRMIANYWGLCSLVDTHVGRILAELERLDLDEKTIVVFTSDHGDMMGAHRMLAKTVMFEEAVRVPMTVRLPGQREARRIAPPVSQVNLVPTLLELMGQEIPAELQGHSLVPSMFDESADGREPVIIEWNGANNGMAGGMEDGRALPDWALEMASPDRIARALQDPLRTVVDPSGWKLTVSTIGEHQLFHLGEDPWERYPRYGEPGTEPIVAKLRGALDAWRRKTGDRVGPTT